FSILLLISSLLTRLSSDLLKRESASRRIFKPFTIMQTVTKRSCSPDASGARDTASFQTFNFLSNKLKLFHLYIFEIKDIIAVDVRFHRFRSKIIAVMELDVFR